MLECIIIIAILAVVLITAYTLIVGAPPVPTPKRVASQMLELAAIKPGETVYDLGSGDGRLIFAAAKQGAKAVGLEISPVMYPWSYLRKIAKRSPAQLRFRDFLWTDLSPADVILIYMFPTTNELLLPKKLKRELKPGSRVISLAFEIPGLDLQDKVKAKSYPGYIFSYQV